MSFLDAWVNDEVHALGEGANLTEVVVELMVERLNARALGASDWTPSGGWEAWRNADGLVDALEGSPFQSECEQHGVVPGAIRAAHAAQWFHRRWNHGWDDVEKRPYAVGTRHPSSEDHAAACTPCAPDDSTPWAWTPCAPSANTYGPVEREEVAACSFSEFWRQYKFITGGRGKGHQIVRRTEPTIVSIKPHMPTSWNKRGHDSGPTTAASSTASRSTMAIGRRRTRSSRPSTRVRRRSAGTTFATSSSSKRARRWRTAARRPPRPAHAPRTPPQLSQDLRDFRSLV